MFGKIHIMVFTLLSLNWGLIATVYGGLVELPGLYFEELVNVFYVFNICPSSLTVIGEKNNIISP
jgi:hypothetical protein